jgi:hypothetical protein
MLSSISPRPTQMHISRGSGLLLTNPEGLVSDKGDRGSVWPVLVSGVLAPREAVQNANQLDARHPSH